MTQDELKHMDYIQSAISRIASNQFQIKGWAITLGTAILTLFANSLNNPDGPNAYFLLIAIFPMLLFWIIDAKFLSTERRLRRIYMDIAEHKADIRPFDMPTGKYHSGYYSFFSALFSLNNILVYLCAIVALFGGFVYFTFFR